MSYSEESEKNTYNSRENKQLGETYREAESRIEKSDAFQRNLGQKMDANCQNNFPNEISMQSDASIERQIYSMQNPELSLFVFKEITEITLLEKVFRDRSQYFCNGSDCKIDIDEYDIHSRHYGLFLKLQSEEILAGYLRITWDNHEKYNEQAINAIVLKTKSELSKRQFISEAFTYYDFDIKNKLSEHFRVGENFDYIVCETDCLFIYPQFRPLKLMPFMVECIMTVICSSLIFPIGIANVAESFRLFYLRNGFEVINSIESFNGVKEIRHLMAISYNGVKTKLLDLESRIEMFNKKGEITITHFNSQTTPQSY